MEDLRVAGREENYFFPCLATCSSCENVVYSARRLHMSSISDFHIPACVFIIRLQRLEKVNNTLPRDHKSSFVNEEAEAPSLTTLFQMKIETKSTRGRRFRRRRREACSPASSAVSLQARPGPEHANSTRRQVSDVPLT